MNASEAVKWDLFVRIFHWSLVTLVVLAYLSGEYDIAKFHSWLGYGILILVLCRLVWGFIGSKNARFSTFIYSPRETIAYMVSAIKNRPIHYVSHNPAGALMVFGLLALLLVLTVSGLVYEGWGEYEGPLWAMHLMPSDTIGHFAWVVHRELPELLFLLVPLHLMGVVIATIQHKENFVRAMVFGRDK